MVDRQQHWEKVYRNRAADQVSWFQPHAASSLRLIAASADKKDANIIDVGGGASVLVDDLADAGYRNLSVLDLAESALAASRARLGARAQSVQWIAGDITRAELPAARYDVWHDRAVFHFLTESAQQAAYLAALRAGTSAGSSVIMATFALDGPEKCSDLPVQRYSPATLAARLGPAFVLMRQADETHETPWGSQQRFTYAMFKRQP